VRGGLRTEPGEDLVPEWQRIAQKPMIPSKKKKKKKTGVKVGRLNIRKRRRRLTQEVAHRAPCHPDIRRVTGDQMVR
jgi:hypothetical protein